MWHLLFHWHRPEWRVVRYDKYWFPQVVCGKCYTLREILGYNYREMTAEERSREWDKHERSIGGGL